MNLNVIYKFVQVCFKLLAYVDECGFGVYFFFARTIGLSDERRQRIVVQVNAAREYLRSPRALGLRQTGHALAVAPWGWWPCVFRRTLRFGYRRRCPTVEGAGDKFLGVIEFNKKFIKLFSRY